MQKITEKNGYKILEWDGELTGKKLGVVSDLHIGYKASFFQTPLSRLKSGIAEGAFDFIVINGDLSDGPAYFEAGPYTHLSDKIRGHLIELLEQTPHVPVIITRGNHDLAIHYQKMLDEMVRAYPGRLFVCDALMMKDSIFIHGDFSNHEPCSNDHICERLNDSARERLVLSSDKETGRIMEDYPATMRNVSRRLYEVLGEMYNNLTHIFVGHFHPQNPFHNMKIPGEYADHKTYHMTGCAKDNKLSTILRVVFDAQGVDRVTLYSLDRNPDTQISGGAPLNENRVAASPQR